MARSRIKSVQRGTWDIIGANATANQTVTAVDRPRSHITISERMPGSLWHQGHCRHAFSTDTNVITTRGSANDATSATNNFEIIEEFGP